MGIAKRVHQKIIEGVISRAQGERIVNRLLTPQRPEPVKGEQMTLFGRKGK